MRLPYKILFIDDDELVRGVVAHAFREPTWRLELREGAMNATNVARSFRPDVVLLDMLLPAIPGSELIALMRSTARSASGRPSLFFLYSGADEDDVRRAARIANFDGYFPKTTPISRIERQLRAIVSQRLLTPAPSSLHSTDSLSTFRTSLKK